MTTDDFSVATLADAVASGRVVDWQAAEQSADTAEAQEVVRQLGVLAALSAAYRTAASPVTDDQPITRWGRFESLTPIGAGTYGTVYQCWDPLLERPVALKLLHSTSSDDRALAEARLLAKVRHPNVVTVYGADFADGRLGLWMELLPGRSLKEDVAVRGRLSERDAALVGAELCRGLAAVHKASLVHGDVKAQNVIREPDGRVVLTDFGAGVNHDAAAHAAPAAGGTPYYMAPELFEGGSVSVRSDVYSVGVLLFYLVTGTFPIVADSYDELTAAHRAGRRRALSELRPDMSPAFAGVVERAMAARADERFGGVLEIEAALQHVLRRGDKRARRLWPVMTGVAALAGAIGVGIAVLVPRPPTAAANVVRSIAVLPFANLSGKADEEYLADGVTDMLTSNLAQLSALRVTSRTSAMRYKNKDEALPDIGKALHVDALVEGSMMHADGRVRVTAQVIRVSTDEHVWAQTFEGLDSNLFALQAEMASAIASAIKVAVTPSERERVRAPHAIKAAAQDAYLRARYLMDQLTADSQSRAFDFLKKAIEIDPSYARAYAALARNYILLEGFGLIPRASAFGAAYEAASHAIALDDELADGHAELADILLYHKWNWSGADREYRRSLELNPSNTLARSHYSRFLSAIGRHRDALEHARMTVESDPFSQEALHSVPLALYYSGRFEEAAQGFQAALLVIPHSAESHFGLGRALAGTEDFVGAEREIRDAIRLTESWAIYNLELARTIAAAGRPTECLQVVHAIEAAGQRVSPQYLAYIHAALGHRDEAFAYLDKAVQDRAPGLLWAKVDPRLASLREDARFRLLLKTIGVPEYVTNERRQ